jgi:hypothetical protein
MTQTKQRSIATIRLEALIRLFNLSTISRFNDSVLLTEYPKSGGTWLGEMVADVCAIDFPQNRFPSSTRCLYHGHYLRRFPSVKTIVLWRDPRDIVVSWYYHTLTSTVGHSSMQYHALRHLDFTDVGDIKSNLPAFIEYMFTAQRTPKFTWTEFFDFWFDDTEAFHTSYEQLSHDAGHELTELCRFFGIPTSDDRIRAIVSARSFEAKSGRKRGQGDPSSFMRKGVPGDWVNCFSEDAVNSLQLRIGHRLEKYCNRFHN